MTHHPTWTGDRPPEEEIIGHAEPDSECVPAMIVVGAFGVVLGTLLGWIIK